MLTLGEPRSANILLVFRLALPLLAALLLPLADCITSVATAESAPTSTSADADAATPGDTDAYLAQLRRALPQGWLQREFQRQRSFSAFAHSRQLVAKGQYEEAFHELESYLASTRTTSLSSSDISFSRPTLSVTVSRSVQPTGSSLTCRILHPRYFTVGSPGRPWARTKKRYRIWPPPWTAKRWHPLIANMRAAP